MWLPSMFINKISHLCTCLYPVVCTEHQASDGYRAQQLPHGLADSSVFPDDCGRGGLLCHRFGILLLTGEVCLCLTHRKSNVETTENTSAVEQERYVDVFVESHFALKAPSNMKSVLQAGWLLTVAVGNIIVLIVAEAAKLPDQVCGSYLSVSRCDSVLTNLRQVYAIFYSSPEVQYRNVFICFGKIDSQTDFF